MIKVIFLDIDNTILDFDAYVKQTMQNGFALFNIGPYYDDMFNTFTSINNKLWLQIESGEIDFNVLQRIRWNLIFEKLGYQFDGPTFEKYFRAALNESAIPINGALEVLSKLSKQYVLCAATNGPHNQQVNRIRLAGMGSYFSHIFTSELIGFSKPSKQFFDGCMDRLNENLNDKIKSEDILMIGDSLTSDIGGAISYGMKTCYYNRKKKEISTEYKIDYIVYNLEEICSLEIE